MQNVGGRLEKFYWNGSLSQDSPDSLDTVNPVGI